MAGAGAINQSELARSCGVRPAAISQLLSGDSQGMSVRVLFRAARTLRVSAEWKLDRAQRKPRAKT